MRFSPGVAQALELPLPTAQHPQSLYFYATASREEWNTAKRVEIWSNLPTTQQSQYCTHDHKWTATPFLILLPTPSSNQNKETTTFEEVKQIYVAEITLDPLHDWNASSQQFEYTIRIVDQETGDVEWLGNGGDNGRIAFTCGTQNAQEGEVNATTETEEERRAAVEKMNGLQEVLNEMENNGETDSDFCKLLRRFVASQQSKGNHETQGEAQQDDCKTLPLISSRLTSPSVLPDASSALIVSQSSYGGAVVTIGFFNPSPSATTDDILDLLDISSVLSPHMPSSRYLLTTSSTIDLITADEIDANKDRPRIFARPMARIVLAPGECRVVSVLRVLEVESSVGDGRKLAVGILGLGGRGEGFEFDDVTSIVLHPTIVTNHEATPIRAKEDPAAIPLQSSTPTKFANKPHPPPLPRVFLLPIYILTLPSLITSSTLHNPKLSSKSLSAEMIDLAKDLITSPFVTTWNEMTSVVKFILAVGLWLLRIVLLNGIETDGVMKGRVRAASLSLYQYIDGADESKEEAIKTAATLAITLKSLDSPLRLYFPSPSSADRLSAQSIVKITFDGKIIENERIVTELAEDGSGMVVELELVGLGESGGEVEISC